MARIVRGQTLSVRRQEFIEAAVASAQALPGTATATTVSTPVATRRRRPDRDHTAARASSTRATTAAAIARNLTDGWNEESVCSSSNPHPQVTATVSASTA